MVCKCLLEAEYIHIYMQYIRGKSSIMYSIECNSRYNSHIRHSSWHCKYTHYQYIDCMYDRHLHYIEHNTNFDIDNRGYSHRNILRRSFDMRTNLCSSYRMTCKEGIAVLLTLQRFNCYMYNYSTSKTHSCRCCITYMLRKHCSWEYTRAGMIKLRFANSNPSCRKDLRR